MERQGFRPHPLELLFGIRGYWVNSLNDFKKNMSNIPRPKLTNQYYFEGRYCLRDIEYKIILNTNFSNNPDDWSQNMIFSKGLLTQLDSNVELPIYIEANFMLNKLLEKETENITDIKEVYFNSPIIEHQKIKNLREYISNSIPKGVEETLFLFASDLENIRIIKN